MKLGDRMGFRENDFQTVRKPRLNPLWPGHGALRRKRGHSLSHFHRACRHQAASFAPASAGKPALAGVRKMIARFSFRRYFFAATWISSRATWITASNAASAASLEYSGLWRMRVVIWVGPL